MAGQPNCWHRRSAGSDLLCKVGEAVGKGEPLYRIYATSQTGLGFARELATENTGYDVTV